MRLFVGGAFLRQASMTALVNLPVCSCYPRKNPRSPASPGRCSPDLLARAGIDRQRRRQTAQWRREIWSRSGHSGRARAFAGRWGLRLRNSAPLCARPPKEFFSWSSRQLLVNLVYLRPRRSKVATSPSTVQTCLILRKRNRPSEIAVIAQDSLARVSSEIFLRRLGGSGFMAS